MSLLLDTNIVLWAALGDSRLSPATLDLLGDNDQALFVSAVTSVEIAIKWSQGKIELPTEPEAFLRNITSAAGYSQLALTIQHAALLAKLPYHHRDPWDRLLIVQAQSSGFRILTSDRKFKLYDVEIVMA